MVFNDSSYGSVIYLLHLSHGLIFQVKAYISVSLLLTLQCATNAIKVLLELGV